MEAPSCQENKNTSFKELKNSPYSSPWVKIKLKLYDKLNLDFYSRVNHNLFLYF